MSRRKQRRHRDDAVKFPDDANDRLKERALAVAASTVEEGESVLGACVVVATASHVPKDVQCLRAKIQLLIEVFQQRGWRPLDPQHRIRAHHSGLFSDASCCDMKKIGREAHDSSQEHRRKHAQLG
jgi:hypothetical protein